MAIGDKLPSPGGADPVSLWGNSHWPGEKQQDKFSRHQSKGKPPVPHRFMCAAGPEDGKSPPWGCSME